ncbi:hypothetical protein HF324_30690 [Chitinophaga oryzae]|uniref:PH domain-containing protein n=1 Tax=Chitinophaga oryzae TaxID=2725414 RepID=A0ABX6LT60_9BACT|nr:hypothetical protein [Chitinophaga oryzae]QJB41980.1 hypothetical protein HF324_30690 [Chitinophaga oryzae]
MTAIKEKEFRFQGLDLRTEMWLGLAILPILVTVLAGLFYLLKTVLSFNLLKIPRGLIIVVVLGTSLFSIHWLAKLIRDKTWIVRVTADRLLIRFRKRQFDIPLDSIREIKNLGSTEHRYLSFFTTDGQTVRIRVGNGAMTPFSKKEDIQTVDDLITHLKPYMDKYFNKKELRNKINQHPFPHCGVYIVKSEPLTYRWIEKLTPGQVILLIFGGGVAFIVLLLQVLFYYIDHKS